MRSTATVSFRSYFLILAFVLLTTFISSSLFVDTSHPLVEESPTLVSSIKEHSIITTRNTAKIGLIWLHKWLSWIPLFPLLLLVLALPPIIYLFRFIPLAIKGIFLMPIKFTSTYVV
ncbi:Uncharacterised protein [Chlamydia abortus]|uniref:hypothetical protein n=1 Tax=unclassified Paenibacillus TaxID=185978 RepID=UPI000A27E7B6|nr:hypothetical protein [Paenibacillus sp. 32O-W]SHE10577.1 Uncharacterised protein [Chlamydia abortus]